MLTKMHNNLAQPFFSNKILIFHELTAVILFFYTQKFIVEIVLGLKQ